MLEILSNKYSRNDGIFYITEKTAPISNKIFNSHYSYTINSIIQSIIDDVDDIFKCVGNQEQLLYAKSIIIPALITDRIIYFKNGKFKCDHKAFHVHCGENKFINSKYTAQAATSIAYKCLKDDDPNDIIIGFDYVQKRSKKYIQERKEIIRKAINEIMTAPYAESEDDKCSVDYSIIIRIESFS
ncbi:hypothetical protein [Fluviispira vulneris]|uniref:hypothetical protein n=1 Tax=Fluviispira vulneris TaxID=2763012 RepID=UPI0016441EBA|nr:hypothetical protein [Fluviispira vulneris]